MLQVPTDVQHGNGWFVYQPDALDDPEVWAINREFPDVDDPGWHTFTGDHEYGKQEGSASIAGPVVAALHEELAGAPFVGWLRGVTGIADLVADPDRVGGGIHQCRPHGKLDMHTDFNVHPTRDLVRAVNVIVFVTDCTAAAWRPEWGGTFDIKGSAPGVTLVLGSAEPAGGTLVAFAACDTLYHGHPTPLSPDAPVRRSVPAYYYRPIRDGEDVEAHSTRWMEDA